MKHLLLILLTIIFSNTSLFSQESSGKTVDTVQVENVIVPPSFKGGNDKLYDYITTNFEYPTESLRRSASGTLEVQFTVEASGDITGVSILRGIDEPVDKEVARLLKNMPRWNPATKNGKEVRYTVSMPLSLKVSRVKNGKSGAYEK